MPDGEYITERELRNLTEELIRKLNDGEVDQVKCDLERILQDTENQTHYIDRTYLAKVKDKRRLTKIADIVAMLNGMDSDQVDNVHVYVRNEHDEPNHEAVALDAIIRLSRERR